MLTHKHTHTLSVSTPPLNFSVIPTNISVNLTWSPPADANGVIFEYIVQLNNSSPEQVLSPTQTHVIEQLIPYTRYVVSVRADTGTNGSIVGTTAVLNFDTLIGSKITFFEICLS